MKQNAGPIAIGIAVLALCGVLYLIFTLAFPSNQMPYDPKSTGPKWLKQNGGSGDPTKMYAPPGQLGNGAAR